ncbi:MAG: hypothetical protein IJ069_11060 [Prevotella sp.]|nr:hypothetical protein [Prevotella sp.]
MKENKKLNKTPMMEIPDVAIEVNKSKGHAPVIMMYEPAIDEDGEVDLCNDFTVTNLSMRQYKKWRKGNVIDKLEIVVKAFQDVIELNKIHKALEHGY